MDLCFFTQLFLLLCLLDVVLDPLFLSAFESESCDLVSRFTNIFLGYLERCCIALLPVAKPLLTREVALFPNSELIAWSSLNCLLDRARECALEAL